MPPQLQSTNSLKMAVYSRFIVSCLQLGERVRRKKDIILVRRGFISDRAISHHQRT